MVFSRLHKITVTICFPISHSIGKLYTSFISFYTLLCFKIIMGCGKATMLRISFLIFNTEFLSLFWKLFLHIELFKVGISDTRTACNFFVFNKPFLLYFIFTLLLYFSVLQSKHDVLNSSKFITSKYFDIFRFVAKPRCFATILSLECLLYFLIVYLYCGKATSLCDTIPIY